MNIWLITTGESLPLFGQRAYRAGILSQLLSRRGHNVTWWTTTFDHQSKKFLFHTDAVKRDEHGVTMQFLHSPISYRRNVSLRRIANHIGVAKKFKMLSAKNPKPDAIFCSFPTIELSVEAVKYGKKNNVPVIVDVRDLWPDIFLQPFPKIVRPMLNLLLWAFRRQAKYVFKNCDGLVSISQKYLDWSLALAGRSDRNTAVVPLGFRAAKTALRPETPSKNGTLTAWFSGTFGTTYDLATVIAGAKLLAKDEPVRIILTGDGEKSSEWKTLAQGVENVAFTGWVDEKRLAQLSDSADIGIMAYRSGAPQGLPNKLFEYMAAGLPILSSLQGETEEFLARYDIGYSYRPGDAAGLAERLRSLAKNPSAVRLKGQRAKTIFEENFDAEKIYERLIHIIEGATCTSST